jgi:hypothetical protein
MITFDISICILYFAKQFALHIFILKRHLYRLVGLSIFQFKANCIAFDFNFLSVSLKKEKEFLNSFELLSNLKRQFRVIISFIMNELIVLAIELPNFHRKDGLILFKVNYHFICIVPYWKLDAHEKLTTESSINK